MELEREAFCKKMRAEIESKRSEFRKDVEAYRKKLRTKSEKNLNPSRGGEETGYYEAAS